MALLTTQSLSGLLVRFAISGMAATFAYFAVANALLGWTTLDPRVASVVAYIFGMVVSFLSQGKFTFRVSWIRMQHLFRFVVLSAFGLLVSYYAVEFAVYRLGVDAFWGTLVTTLVVPVTSFLVMRYWVYAEKQTT